MSVVEEIHKAAARIAQGVKARVSCVQGELAWIKAKKAAIEAELLTARSTQDRLFTFQPQVNGDFQCPACWIEHEKRSVLSTGETAREDFWRCHVCGFEIITSAV